MALELSSNIKPRDVASKSDKENLFKAIQMALEIENSAIKLNTKTFNTNRYTAINNLEDYQDLKLRARVIKEKSINDLPKLIDQLKDVIESRGGIFYLAKDKNDANDYILEVCKSRNTELIVKAKSITSEEIGLNKKLESANIEIAETDLAEFILQISDEQPSHNVAPAIHRSRERITELFKNHFDTELELKTGEELTEFSRDILREKFLSADVGISGANMIDAESGSILLVESEGNIRLSTQIPALHIAISGIEKIVPSRKDFAPFIELLAASGTGQQLTSYTNIIKPPLKTKPFNFNGRGDTGREFHLVLIDNGRMQLREDDELKEALYCIRCSACMNVCANFQSLGGHAFGGECYTGGIGGTWAATTSNDITEARFAELCTGCSRCVPNCPVGINIPSLNTVLKQRLLMKDKKKNLQKVILGNFSKFANIATFIPSIFNWINNNQIVKIIYEKVIGFDKRRKIPKIHKKSLLKMYKDYRKGCNPASSDKYNTLFFADVFTNFNNPKSGLSTIRVFDQLGINITLSDVYSDGRALLSQGLLEQAKKEAIVTADYLVDHIKNGFDIIVSEPSVLAMFRFDYQNLIDQDKFLLISRNTYDPFEYLQMKYKMENTDEIRNHFTKIDPSENKIFIHGHCQLKSIGANNYLEDFLSIIGFDIETSNSECCGMAGSFGYKKEFYEISKNVGEDLVNDIESALENTNHENFTILASGTSCREQISDLGGYEVLHPMEFLESILMANNLQTK